MVGVYLFLRKLKISPKRFAISQYFPCPAKRLRSAGEGIQKLMLINRKMIYIYNTEY